MGIVLGLTVARLVALALGLREIDTPFLYLFAVVAGLLAGLVSGALAGLAQVPVVRRHIRGALWTAATAMGWATGWAVVWLLSHLYPAFGLQGVHIGLVGAASDAGIAEGGVVAWTLVGLSVGLYQWRALWRQVRHSGWWVPFTVVCWGAGAIVAWSFGALLNAEEAMYWSVDLALTAWSTYWPGVISSLAGWAVIGVISGLGMRALFSEKDSSNNRPRRE